MLISCKSQNICQQQKRTQRFRITDNRQSLKRPSHTMNQSERLLLLPNPLTSTASLVQQQNMMIPRSVKMKVDKRLKMMTGKVDGESMMQQSLKEQRLREQQTANRARIRDKRLTARRYQNVLTLLSRSKKVGKMLEQQVAFSRRARRTKEKLESEEVKGRLARQKERRWYFLGSRRTLRPMRTSSVL